jgi:hypothetical protein
MVEGWDPRCRRPGISTSCFSSIQTLRLLVSVYSHLWSHRSDNKISKKSSRPWRDANPGLSGQEVTMQPIERLGPIMLHGGIWSGPPGSTAFVPICLPTKVLARRKHRAHTKKAPDLLLTRYIIRQRSHYWTMSRVARWSGPICCITLVAHFAVLMES